MQKLIECVPNFSEGRDLQVIQQITAAIESVDGVSLLNVDPGASTNRTVVTFVGQSRSGGGSRLPRNSKGGGTDRHAQTQGRSSANGRDRCLPVHPGEQRELGGSDCLCEVVGQTRRRRVEDSRLSLRKGGERSVPIQSVRHPGRRVRRVFREDKGAGLEAGLRTGRIQRDDQARR